MKKALPIALVLILLGLLAYFLWVADDKSPKTTANHESPSQRESNKIAAKKERRGRAKAPKVDDTKAHSDKVSAPPLESLPDEKKDIEVRVEEVPQRGETKPAKSPQQRSAEAFVKSLAEVADAGSFCAAPFLVDGNSLQEDLVSVQDMLTKAAIKAADLGATYKLAELQHFDPSTLDAQSELMQSLFKNKGYAKVLEFAIEHGGQVGMMRMSRTIDGETRDAGEWIALAFNKDGKLIGFKD